MTVVFERQVAGPAVHAFVVGVGSYPHAKVERSNTPSVLWAVEDISSAPAGAKLFADWLIAHRDRLPAPLASVEMLLSDPAGPATYGWKTGPNADGDVAAYDPRGGAASVDAASLASTEAAGSRWSLRFNGGADRHFAVFYICGHGLATMNRSIVFLEDLCGMPHPHSPWQPFLDLQVTVNRMSRTQGLQAAYVFVDACQETLDAFVLHEADPTQGVEASCPIFARDIVPHRNNVLLMVPGPMGSLAYDDGQGTGGRFTKALVAALAGAGARNVSGMGDWAVPVDTLADKVKQVDRLIPRDATVSPQVVKMPSGVPALVTFPGDAPILPMRVLTDPEPAMVQATKVWVEDHLGATIVQKTCIERTWTTHVQARVGLFWIRADFTNGGTENAKRKTVVDLSEMHVEPPLVHKVSP